METHFRILIIMALAIIISAGGVADELESEPNSKTKRVFPTDLRVERHVEFLTEDRSEKADLYLPLEPQKETRLPAVIWIHGGGWNGGQRDGNREINVCSTLARNGYIAMSIDYQLAKGVGAAWPQNLADCKTAVRWLRKNAARLGIDPDHVGVMGGSAGGHLAAMVALTTAADGLDPPGPYGEYSCSVSCCVDMYGISDIGRYHDVRMLGKTLEESPELYRLASPLTYIRTNSPPFLILHGTADNTVNIEQSQWLDESLTRVGVEHELVIIPDAPHTFDLQPKQRDLRPIVLDFLDRHLKTTQSNQ
jgi:acetyl esterase/lipase